jgi:hypothetical protein
MAVTKMHPIRRTVGKAVDYITDNDKTDGEIYVSCENARPEAGQFIPVRILSAEEYDLRGKML